MGQENALAALSLQSQCTQALFVSNAEQNMMYTSRKKNRKIICSIYLSSQEFAGSKSQ